MEAPTRTLLLWGGVNARGELFLEPAFVVTAPPAVPPSPGEYELMGREGTGGEVFSLSFDMMETADGDGRAFFVISLPAQAEWASRLASITLSGPTGSATVDRTTDQPMTIVRDPVSGQVRGILRDPSPADMAGNGVAVGMGGRSSLETAVSRGIPRDADWSRE